MRVDGSAEYESGADLPFRAAGVPVLTLLRLASLSLGEHLLNSLRFGCGSRHEMTNANYQLLRYLDR